MAIQRLPVAYRSRSRPSSALGAKASTVCPYYLDGVKLPIPRRIQRLRVGLSSVVGARRRLIDRRRTVTTVQFSKSAEEACRAGLARRSLKTQQHAGPPPAPEGTGLFGWQPKSGRRSRQIGRVLLGSSHVRRRRVGAGRSVSDPAPLRGASLERR